MILFASALALALAAQASPPAPAQQPPATLTFEPVATLIAACDADGDARTSRAELQACVTRSFTALDTTRKGWLGYIDFADWAQKWLGDRNALPSPFTVDTDHDDHLTLAELQANLAGTFARFDKDKDGVATRGELLTVQSGLPPLERGKRKRRR
jgi:hypothetical protein